MTVTQQTGEALRGMLGAFFKSSQKKSRGRIEPGHLGKGSAPMTSVDKRRPRRFLGQNKHLRLNESINASR